RQLHPELEDAARVAGAGLVKTLRLVVFPLTRPTLMAAWTLLFVLAMQEVSASILLYTSRSTVLSVAVFDLWEAGNVNALAGLSVMQLAVPVLALAWGCMCARSSAGRGVTRMRAKRGLPIGGWAGDRRGGHRRKSWSGCSGFTATSTRPSR